MAVESTFARRVREWQYAQRERPERPYQHDLTPAEIERRYQAAIAEIRRERNRRNCQ